MTMHICFCNIDWVATSAVANLIMAAIAFCTLLFSIYLLFRENKLRKEDLRARLDSSIIKHHGAYFLLIENVGKEAAYDVEILAKSKLIEENLYKLVNETFAKISTMKLIIKGGEKLYFFLCPDKMNKNIRYPWRQEETIEDINRWLTEHETDEITVSIKYNKKYKVFRSFSVKNFNFVGSTKILTPIEQISGVISDMDAYTLDDIKQYLGTISDTLTSYIDAQSSNQ